MPPRLADTIATTSHGTVDPDGATEQQERQEMRLCDQPGCNVPASRITNAGGKEWFSCGEHVATEPTIEECNAVLDEIVNAIRADHSDAYSTVQALGERDTVSAEDVFGGDS
jgi:hypothetical protein